MPERHTDQCRDNCACGNPCSLSRRVPHQFHCCSDRSCVCHNHYHARVNAWTERHYFATDYAKAQAAYRMWQTNPAVLNGPAWTRRNGHTPEATE